MLLLPYPLAKTLPIYTLRRAVAYYLLVVNSVSFLHNRLSLLIFNAAIIISNNVIVYNLYQRKSQHFTQVSALDCLLLMKSINKMLTARYHPALCLKKSWSWYDLLILKFRWWLWCWARCSRRSRHLVYEVIFVTGWKGRIVTNQVYQPVLVYVYITWLLTAI